MARSSAEWWAETKKSPAKFSRWLEKQYHGEMTAAPRIRALTNRHDLMPSEVRTLNLIADQEEQHAAWVADLLKARGIEPRVLQKEERYWDKTLPDAEDSFNYLCAVAAHAEQMRLERIRVIAEDPEAPTDVRVVFEKILKDEEFHAKAFASFAGSRALEQARDKHEQDLVALGLVI